QSAVFNFQSLLVVILLMICTCTYIRSIFPNFIGRHRIGWKGIFWKMSRIGERLSPLVSACCIVMAFYSLLA
ncbi:hypothetical protein KR054_010901, partial [Drosophila jambulina]